MKGIVFLLASVVLCTAIPTNSRDNVANEDNLKVQFIENIDNNNNLEDSDTNEYWLFTRRNPTIPQIISNGNLLSLWTSNYDSSKPLNVIVHGWTRDGTYRANTMITAAFLETSDVNVIVVDWRIRASGEYIPVSLSVPSVARDLANFLQWLIMFGGGNWDNVHLIGHSLGAHLVGNTGRDLGGRARRVTGMDPAGPFWSNSFALNTQSGRYVEVIHTDIMSQGTTEPIGHTDFYPSGGRDQPGCDSSACNHLRAYELFASSVRTDHFVGRRCTNLLQAMLNLCNGVTLNMGNGNMNKTGSGIYALSTGGVWPF